MGKAAVKGVLKTIEGRVIELNEGKLFEVSIENPSVFYLP